MKYFPGLFNVLLAGVIFWSVSCKKHTDPVPRYPELIGQWTGTTSQGAAIQIIIYTVDGILYVTQYDLTVYTPSGYQQYRQYNSSGIVSLSDKQFTIPLGSGNAGPAYLDGTFSLNEMILNGNFAVYPSGNSVDLIIGYYSCSKIK